MKKRITVIVALVLVLALTLSGCTGVSVLGQLMSWLQLGLATEFDEMEYVRPDMDEFRQKLEQTLEEIPAATDADKLMESVYELYEFYYDFFTSYYLAEIHYCIDMTDIYWDQEYTWCMENSSEVTAGLDQLLYALADCSLRETLESDEYFGADFFDAYEGDSVWDDTFTDLMNQEAALVDRYYELNAQAEALDPYSEEYFTGCGAQIEEVFVELIAVRQQIAAYAGYDSYADFAYEYYYYRDYTAAQAESYLLQIKEELVPLYLSLDSSALEPVGGICTEEQTFAYTRECADSLGSVASEAFRLMEEAGLYDISYSPNKYDASFEVYLMSYYVPFVFMNPSGGTGDQLTFTHEFGHFCRDYATGGSLVGVDVAEVFSQGLEYLSLYYCDNTESLKHMKMANSLCVFVEQAAYASFELQAYALEGDELTVENVRAVFSRTCEDYGLSRYGVDSRAYTLIPHFFISSMYVIGYVVSNDVAMQIYQQEAAEQGAGAALWEDGLFTQQVGILGFAEEMGLEDPFKDGRAKELRATFEKEFG